MFYEKKQEIPKAKNFPTIRQKIVRNKWHTFGINSWNDLVRRAIGKVNVKTDLYTPDETGLEKAVLKIKEMEKQLERLPKSNDKGLGGIKSAIDRGRWINFGIKKGSWNDLLQRACGKINVEREIYTKDKNGLEKAKKKLKTFFETNNRYPKSTDKDMNIIVTAIHRKRWEEYEICKWKDLFRIVFEFDPEILKRNIYDGKEGLRRAQKELQEFYEKNKRLPKYADKELNPIRHMASSGRWHQWGIKNGMI